MHSTNVIISNYTLIYSADGGVAGADGARQAAVLSTQTCGSRDTQRVLRAPHETVETAH